jgi:hypothetical protein
VTSSFALTPAFLGLDAELGSFHGGFARNFSVTCTVTGWVWPCSVRRFLPLDSAAVDLNTSELSAREMQKSRSRRYLGICCHAAGRPNVNFCERRSAAPALERVQGTAVNLDDIGKPLASSQQPAQPKTTAANR